MCDAVLLQGRQPVLGILWKRHLLRNRQGHDPDGLDERRNSDYDGASPMDEQYTLDLHLYRTRKKSNLFIHSRCVGIHLPGTSVRTGVFRVACRDYEVDTESCSSALADATPEAPR